jgi:hypothetical protein
VGDVIPLNELAERLYIGVYLVARHASREFLALQSEVAALNMYINLLIAEAKDENSTLTRCGEERVNTIYHDSDLDGMDYSRIESYFHSSDYDERRIKHLVAFAVFDVFPF